MDIFAFGDQTVDSHTFLAQALLRKENPFLTTFLQRTQVALRDEIQRLPRYRRDQIPQFSTIHELSRRYYASEARDPALDSTLLCISQLAHWIGLHEENPLEYPDPKDAQILGVCTGLLAASAVASCSSLASLIPLAVETVTIAFRTGALVAANSDSLEKCSTEDSWSTVVGGQQAHSMQDEIDNFNEGQGLSNTSKLYLSASGLSNVTISGPPAQRKLFFEDSSCKKSSQLQIPIRAPYHASHLFNEGDLDDILSAEIASCLEQYPVVFGISSAVTGDRIPARNALQLFRQALREILIEPIFWDKVVEKCVSCVKENDADSVRVLAVGPTILGNSVVSALKLAGIQNISLEDTVSWLNSNKLPRHAGGNLAKSKIAIVGMAGRFPDAADHEAFWKLLERGLDVHREVPADRFNAKDHCDPSGKSRNKTHTPYGCFIDNPGLFDPRFFNMSPREATQTDPMQRLAITTAYEAMEMAGFVPNRTPSTQLDRIGTFYGQTSDDWREINAAQDIDTYFITGGVRAFGPGRINYHFNFSGPSFSIDTACSSSLAAVNLACNSLRAGDCDTVFAGGMNVMTNPDIFSGLSKGQFLSKTGSCKTYDNEADGYCRGDGVVTVILKRYDDAIADQDTILGVIAGIGTNHSAEAISITHPHEGAQRFLFQQVMDQAGVDVNQVGYVEMHGTGTQAGDGVEMGSVSHVFAPSHKKRRSDQPLYLGSAKANVGHGEAVSGVTALVKILMMLEKEAIPPHCGIKTKINQSFPKDLKERNVNIATQRIPFPRKADGKRYVFLNNFSAAGGNTAMLIEDAPRKPEMCEDPRTMNIVCISAKSLGSFRKNIERLLSYIDNSSPDFGSLAYTTTARRSHYNYRIAIPAESLPQLVEQLSKLRGVSQSPVASAAPKVAFAFTGQGSHYLGLAQKLFEDSDKFRSDILAFDRTVRAQGFESFVGLVNGELKDLAVLSPIVVQLGITCVQMALTALWKSWGVQPSVVIGHSLGEYAALQAAGVLSASDVIYLVGTRATLLVEKCEVGTHGMLAMRGDFSLVKDLIEHIPTEVACNNGPQDTVFSGTKEQIQNTIRAFNAQGFKCTELDVPFAFHSAQVDPILEEFESAARSAVFHKPTVPVISPLMRDIVREGNVFTPKYLSRHCRERVDFSGAFMEAILDGAVDEKTIWLEIGPHPVCSNMIKSSLPSATIAHTLRRGEDPWKTTTSALTTLYNQGVPLDWNEYHRDFNDTHELLRLPTYAFDEKVYWIQYGPNNWCLTKGDATVSVSKENKAVPKLSTTSVHTIVEEDVKDNIALVVGQSDLAEPLLRAAISGHLVNGAGLCPSSLYADMALTLCDYAYRLIRPATKSEDIHMNVRSMETHKPLVVDLKAPVETQLLQMETKVDLDQNRAEIVFRGVYADGKPAAEYARCKVDYEEGAEWLTTWKRNEFLVKSRVDILKTKMKTGQAHRILRGMAYKLFAALVTYDQKYRGMEEVILDSEELEATSKVVFQSTAKDGNFFMSPYFIDSVAHIAGFIMNANDAVDSRNSVYISHGWENMRFSERLQADQTYTSWVKMQPLPGQGKMVIGDVYVFKNGTPIGVVGGLKFQCVPRNLLDTLLKPARSPNRAALSPALRSSPALVKSSQKAFPSTKPKIAKRGQKPTLAPLRVLDSRNHVHELPLKSPAEIAKAKGVTRQAMEIVATEIGCDMSELQNNVEFSQIGCDSLMSLTISGRFREDLELNVPSTLFIDYPTVLHMKAYLAQFEDVDPVYSSSSSSTESSGAASPMSITGSDTDDDAGFILHEEISDSSDDDESTKRIIRTTIANEMGMEFEEISGNTDLSQLGMDSLMSLSILGALRENTGLNFHSDFLLENNSINDIETTLFGKRKPAPPPLVKIDPIPTVKSQKKLSRSRGNTVSRPPTLLLPTPPRSPTGKLLLRSPRSPAVSKKSATPIYPPSASILLQGDPKTATRKLFLLPDGSGCASAYGPISDIDTKNVCVYGMSCPFMKDPDSFTIGVPEVVRIYIAEIKRRQPVGPYMLGGWSAGGVFAFETTRQLIKNGDQVERLVLLDSPCPVKLEALPPMFHRFCNKIGLLGDGTHKIPDWLLPHFRSTVRELTNYSEMLDDWLESGIIGEKSGFMNKMPITTVIWARDGVCKNPEDPRPDKLDRMPNSMQWLVENRTDFGSNGWEQLLPEGKVRSLQIDGNHFTMMRDPIVKELGPLIKLALEN